MFVNNNKHPQLKSMCFSRYLKQYSGYRSETCFDGPTCTQVLKVFVNIHINNSNLHNKLQRKILLDKTICIQCTFHVNNSILNQYYILKLGNTGRVLVTIQLCPSTNPFLGPNHHYYCTPGDCTCMHAVKKGRRLENEKFFGHVSTCTWCVSASVY